MANRYSELKKLPLQVAAVCYRANGSGIEFLLVNTNGGKWTFPKGCTISGMSHSQAAAQEALEEAGAFGSIEPAPFDIYVHAKGVFWKKPGIREFAVKAFLLEVEQRKAPREFLRNPTWFSCSDARRVLAQGREIKYRNELSRVIDTALVNIRQRRSALPRRMIISQ